jgi:hypothetical protein
MNALTRESACEKVEPMQLPAPHARKTIVMEQFSVKRSREGKASAFERRVVMSEGEGAGRTFRSTADVPRLMAERGKVEEEVGQKIRCERRCSPTRLTRMP